MPEKTVNEIPRDLRVIFTKGQDALLRDNFDYAIALFNQVLAREPALLECRRALRNAQHSKSKGRGGFFKKVWSSTSSSPQVLKAQATLHSDPAAALVIAEEILNADPDNSRAHRVVVNAATALDFPQTAIMSLEVLVQNSPKDKAVAIEFATRVAGTGDVQRAERLLQDLYRLSPNDADLAQALKDISARRTLGEGGYDKLADGQGSYRDILKNETEAKSLEQENRMQKSEDVAERLISEYETRLQTDPNNLKLVRQLAELYTQKKQFDRSLAMYDRIKASGMGNDPSLDRAVAETKMRKFDEQIHTLDPTSADHSELVTQLTAEKVAFQVAECQQRVEKFPTDLAIRFEMGALYFQAGKVGEAIQELQKAQGNTHKRIAAMNLLAQCFAKRKMHDLAAKTLQNALKEKLVFDDEKKELIYNLGCVFEAMGKKEEAIEQLKLIYETDIGYKDVAAKVDAYYSGQ